MPADPVTVRSQRRTQEERSASTRQAVLEATIECLVEQGFSGTSTTAIQLRAGVSRGALTHQFPSKNELLTAAITHLTEVRAAELLASVDRNPHADPIDAGLRLLWESFDTDLFRASLELWVASRTDDDLHSVLIDAERATARTYARKAEAVFGTVASKDGFSAALESVITHMRGAALTDVLRRSSRTEQTIAECRAIFDAAGCGS